MKNNQIRKHLKFENVHKKRLSHHKKILGNCGDHVFFDKNIEIMRFPKNIIIGDNVIIKEGEKICIQCTCQSLNTMEHDRCKSINKIMLPKFQSAVARYKIDCKYWD